MESSAPPSPPSPPPSLHPLPSSTRSALRSSLVVPDVASALHELLVNSADAGAKCIQCVVDWEKRKFTVYDNGVGMRATELQQIGSRHHTSKWLVAALLELRKRGERGRNMRKITRI